MREPSLRVIALCGHALSTALVTVALLLPSAAGAQDLSSFFRTPPLPGAWARYHIETRNPAEPGATAKTKTFTLAVTGAETRSGRPCVWVEVSPMDLAGDKDGTLRILIPAAPDPKEDGNPFGSLQAAQFLPRDGEAYALTAAVVSVVRSQAAGARVVQQRKLLGTEERAVGNDPPLASEKYHVRTSSEGEFFFRRRTLVEEGTYWYCPQLPFHLVEAELTRVETKDGGTPRQRVVTVKLEAVGATGATSVFPAGLTRTRGILSLLFH